MLRTPRRFLGTGDEDFAATTAAFRSQVDNQSAVLITSRLCSITTMVLPCRVVYAVRRAVAEYRRSADRCRLVENIQRLPGAAF